MSTEIEPSIPLCTKILRTRYSDNPSLWKSEYYKKWRKRRKQKGLCIRCQKRRVDKNHCRFHQREYVEATRIRRAKIPRRSGKCVQCGRRTNHARRLCWYHMRLKREREIASYKTKRRWYAKCRTRRMRLAAIRAYGNKCYCCGEQRIEFLSIEHTNGSGAAHRRSLGNAKCRFYIWLRQQGYPKNLGLAVLCMNCNSSRGFLGYCPHEKGHPPFMPERPKFD